MYPMWNYYICNYNLKALSIWQWRSKISIQLCKDINNILEESRECDWTSCSYSSELASTVSDADSLQIYIVRIYMTISVSISIFGVIIIITKSY